MCDEPLCLVFGSFGRYVSVQRIPTVYLDPSMSTGGTSLTQPGHILVYYLTRTYSTYTCTSAPVRMTSTET